MNTQKFIKQLKLEVDDLRYSFKETDDSFELSIGDKSLSLLKADSSFKCKPNDWMAEKHLGGNIHEPGLVATLSLLSKLLDEKVVFYDLGALFAYHSDIANMFFENIEVVTVEGNPHSHECINRQTARFNNFRNLNAVIGKIKSKDRYTIQGFHFNNISKPGIEKTYFDKFKAVARTILRLIRLRKVYEIETIVIPDLFKYNPENDREIFKIDTEGYQSIFLPPHVKTLCERNAIVLMELDNPMKMLQFDSTNDDMVQPFIKAGYRAVWINHRNACGIRELQSIDSATDKNSLVILLPENFLRSENS